MKSLIKISTEWKVLINELAGNENSKEFLKNFWSLFKGYLLSKIHFNSIEPYSPSKDSLLIIYFELFREKPLLAARAIA